MLSFNRRGDQVISIDVTDVPSKGLRPTDWDLIAAELDENMGGDWRVVKMSGRWIVFDKNTAGTGTRESRLVTTSLLKALGDATGLAIVKRV